MIRCTSCGHESIESSKFCRACGNPFSKDVAASTSSQSPQLCSNCAAPVATEAKFCKKCGTPTRMPGEAASGPVSEASAIAREKIPEAIGGASAIGSAAPPDNKAGTLHDDGSSVQRQTDAAAPSASSDSLAACPNCSLALPPNAKFCKGCGSAIAPQESSLSPPQDLATSASSEQIHQQSVSSPPMPAGANGQPDLPANSSKLIVGLLTAAAVIAVLGGVGIFVWQSSKTADSASTAPVDSAPSQSAAASSTPATAPSAPVPAAPGQATSVSEAPIAEPAVSSESADNKQNSSEQNVPAVASPQTAAGNAPPGPPATTIQVPQRDKPVHAEKPIAPTVSMPQPAVMPSTGPKNPDPLTQKITALLAKAEGYIGTQQFDKAIATAESVLELDPGNASAAATIKRAKTKQMELLKSGSTVE